ncbi:MAG: hypothetical protein EBW87_05160, partial [Burkholderiaceae bacterium]|nr:hypothetical protein [Burkholderiaceae bacterium]
EEENPGYTFDMYFGVPAKAGVASPSDLRNTASQLEINKSDLNDEITRWRNTVERSLGKITTKQVNGKTRYYAGTTDITEEYDLYNDRLDGIEAQKWELNEIESQAKLDAGLPPNYTPNQKVLDEAQAAYDLHMQNSSAAYTKSGFDQGTLEERQRGAQYAYNKVIDNSNDANLRAYRAALAKNAKDRTDVRGVTTFSKAVRPEMDRIGNQLIASTSGILKARDIATGKELTDLEDYGTAVENIGWDINKGELELVYKTGEKNKSGDFVPSNKTVSITAPPELVTQLVKKGIVDPVDLEISKQIGDFGGKVKLGNFDATIEIKRNAQTGPIPYVVTVETDQGPYRVAFSSKGKAIKFINQAAKTYNGN